MQKLPLLSEPGNGKLRRLLIPVSIVCVLASIGYGTKIYLENADPDPVLQARPKKKEPAPPDPQEKKEAIKPVASVSPISGGSATVGQLTALYSAVDLKRAEVTLLELEKKIKELEASTEPTPVIVAAPGSPSVFPSAYPSLPKEGDVSPSVPINAFPKIVAIEGIDGRLQATLSSNSGVQKVKVGDDIDQGRIETITASAVVVRTDSGSKSLMFED